MSKRTSYEIKKNILYCVREKPSTYAQLERKINTGFRSIKENCVELKSFGQVDIKLLKGNPANGRPYHLVSITKDGLDFIRRKEKKK